MANLAQTTRMSELLIPIRYIETASHDGDIKQSAWFDFLVGGFTQFAAVLMTGTNTDGLAFSVLQDGAIDTALFQVTFTDSDAMVFVNFSIHDIDTSLYTRIRLRVAPGDTNTNVYGAVLFGSGARYSPAADNLSVSFLQTQGVVNGTLETFFDGIS